MNEIQELEKMSLPIPMEAKALTITDNPTYERATVILREIKTIRSRIADTFNPIIKKAYEAHREAVAQKKKVEAPLEEAEGLLKPKIAQYLDEEEKKRLAREAELQKQAKALVEDETIDRAIEAEQSGDHEGAEAILAEDPQVSPVIVPSSLPKTPGVNDRKIWKWKFKDPKKVSADFLIPDEKKIGGVVRSMGKDAERLVGGIEVYQERVIAGKSL